jgi:hypothetical protein
MDKSRVQQKLQEVLDWLEEQNTLEDAFESACWNRLKSVKRIRVTRKIATACMKPFHGGDYMIFVNLEFLEKHVFGSDHSVHNFAFILLHEVLHRERRDGSRLLNGLDKHWSGKFQNFILDIFVNSTLYHRGFPPSETVTRSIYDASSLSFLLLAPHHLLENLNQNMDAELTMNDETFSTKSYTELKNPKQHRGNFRSLVEEPLRQQLSDALEQGSADPGDTYTQLLKCYLDVWFDRPALIQVARTVANLVNRIPRIPSLGGHHDPRGKSGRGDGETEELELDTRWKQKVNQFVRIVKKALVESDQISSPRYQQTSRRGIRPSLDRRSSYLMASRTWPVFFNNDIESKVRTREAAYIYIDSSGSMSDELVQFISCLVLGADEYISNPVYLFTTEVKPVKLKELQSGLRLSGGTKINAPIDHAREKGLEQLVLITDGYVEDLKPKNQSYLKEADLFTIFDYDAQEPLDAISTEYWGNIEDMIRL